MLASAGHLFIMNFKRRTIRIGGERVAVQVVDPSSLAGNLGDYDSEKDLVRISASLSPSRRLFVFFHEMAHRALIQSSVSLKHDTEEAVCDCFANIMVALFKQNPAIVGKDLLGGLDCPRRNEKSRP